MQLNDIPTGTPVIVGDVAVPMPELAPGDSVIAVGRIGQLLVVDADARRAAEEAVDEAHAAFTAMRDTSPEAVTAFFRGFADRLADDDVWSLVADANAVDVERAIAAGRSTTRLKISEKMRDGMVDGLRGWADSPCRSGAVIETRTVDDWRVERRVAPLGVVAFVFEGRPNVFADGAGVLRNGNAAVMRIGGDALDTAVAIETHALGPALDDAGLPRGAVRLVRSRAHAAGQVLFTLPKVRLAVARGSGPTVALLGAIAEQSGIPASLHGTGGAWMWIEESADPDAVRNAVRASLDRKVCNTLNCVVLERSAAATLGPVLASVLDEIGAVVHVVDGSEGVVVASDVVDESVLATEWEWEDVPECTFVCADDPAAAASLVNRWSPRFVASVLSQRPGAFDEFYASVDAPYVGNGFTRWVDGQWAWDRPELGLTNWERGRLLGRSGILSGDDIVTVRDVFIDTTGVAPQAR